MEAMVTVFAPGRGPCLRCLFPQAPQGWVPNCNEAGVLGPLVGLAGAAQAVEAIKLLSGSDTQSLIGRLWMADARDLSIRTLAIRQRAECATCSRPRELIELAGPAPSVAEITADQLAALEMRR
jgi:sulfur-carrier protein adenylyltransferase/sulfurtransferase